MARILKEITDGANMLTVMIIAIMSLTWLAAKDAVMIVAPILVWMSGALLALAALAITYIFIERQLTARAETRRDRTIAKNQAILSDNEIVLANLQAESRALLIRAAVIQIGRGRIFPTQLGEGIKFSAYPASIIKDAGSDVPLIEAPVEPILPLLKSKERIMIYGAPDSGKTTLLRHLVDAKLEIGSVLAIDPHGNTPKWGHVNHIGQGRDFRAISIILPQIVAEIERRYKLEITTPETIGNHPMVTIVIDELRAIVNNCKEAGRDLAQIICEGRKANVHIIFVAHSKTVKGLGIEGEGDIRAGISQVTLFGDKDAARTATHHVIGFDKPTPFLLPGPYPDRNFNQQVQQAKSGFTEVKETESIFDLNVEPKNSEQMIDQMVIDCYLETGSYGAAYRLLYEMENNKPYEGGKLGNFHRNKVKAILDRNNVKHPVEAGKGENRE